MSHGHDAVLVHCTAAGNNALLTAPAGDLAGVGMRLKGGSGCGYTEESKPAMAAMHTAAPGRTEEGTAAHLLQD